MRDFINIVEFLGRKKPLTVAQIRKRIADIQQEKDRIIRDPARRADVIRLSDEQRELSQQIGTVMESLLESNRQPSPELIRWMQRWVESSFQIQDQIALFAPLVEEASLYLNVSYPVIYRGLSITEDQAADLDAGQDVVIEAHRLQSWTKSRGIADDYALPGYGGDVGVLVKKPGSHVIVRLDVLNVMRKMPRGTYSGAVAKDAMREKEVIVETTGSMILRPRDIVRKR